MGRREEGKRRKGKEGEWGMGNQSRLLQKGGVKGGARANGKLLAGARLVPADLPPFVCACVCAYARAWMRGCRRACALECTFVCACNTLVRARMCVGDFLNS